MVESRGSFLHDILYSFLPFSISKLRAILVIPILTKLFGPETYGLWVQYSISLILITKFASLGLQNSMNRYLPDADTDLLREDYYTILTLTMLVAALSSFGIILFRTQVSVIFFPGPNGGFIILLLAVAAVLNVYFAQSLQFLRSQRRMKSMNLWRSARIIGEIGCLLIGGLLLSSIVDVFIGIVVLYTVFALALFCQILSLINITSPNFSNIRKHLHYGLPLLFSSIAYWVVNTSDRYIVTAFLGLEAVGTYSVIYAIATVIGMISHPIVDVLFPDFSSLKNRGETRELQSRLSGTLRYFLLFAVPATAGAVILRSPIIRLLSTAEITTNGIIISILAPAMALYGVFNILLQVLKVNHQPRTVSIIWGVIAALNITLNLLLVPIFEIVGAAIATFAAFVTGLLLSWWLLREILSGATLKFVRIVASTGIMSAVVLGMMSFFTPVNTLTLGLLTGVGFVVYFVSVYWMNVLTQEEIKRMKKSVKEVY